MKQHKIEQTWTFQEFAETELVKAVFRGFDDSLEHRWRHSDLDKITILAGYKIDGKPFMHYRLRSGMEILAQVRLAICIDTTPFRVVSFKDGWITLGEERLPKTPGTREMIRDHGLCVTTDF